MNIALFYYDGSSEFEIATMALLFKRRDLIAVELAQHMGQYQASKDYEADIRWFKNIR